MRTNILLLGLWLCPLASSAADRVFDIKPGLWELADTVQISGLPPALNLDKMTPEQRARVEAAMKNMAARPITTTRKTCVTREGIEQAIADAHSTRTNKCAPKLVSSTASKVQLLIDCTQENGAMKSKGELTLDRRDSGHFTGTGAVKSAGANGRTMDMKWSMTGTFVSSDCGTVKPAGQ